MLLGEINLLAAVLPLQAASPQMLAVSMRDAARTRAFPIQTARSRIKRNLVDAPAALRGNAKPELVPSGIVIDCNGSGRRGRP